MDTLARLFEHNQWANLELIAACTALTEEQLGAALLPGSEWSIRRTLIHIGEAQQGYLSLLTLPPEARSKCTLSFAELRGSITRTGEALLVLVRDGALDRLTSRLRTRDGYLVEPWVVLLQVLNHATDHRRQVQSMLRALGVTPPRIDGWAFGEFAGGMEAVSL
jgi:uncharacterized damage-inducible protein DinB